VTRQIRLAPEAVAEAREASRWYEERSPGIGAALLDEVATAVADLSRWPGAGGLIEGVLFDGEVRRVPVGRFPYHLVYTFTDDDVHVLAVAHDRREQGYWASRRGG
jgi:toxin ParE1/3/4